MSKYKKNYLWLRVNADFSFENSSRLKTYDI